MSVPAGNLLLIVTGNCSISIVPESGLSSLPDMSNKRGRKRKLEKELDELVLQDSRAQKSEESASRVSEPISLGNGGDTVATESSSQNRCGSQLPDHHEDSSKKAKANGQGQ